MKRALLATAMVAAMTANAAAEEIKLGLRSCRLDLHRCGRRDNRC